MYIGKIVKIKAMGVSEENSSGRSKGQQNNRGGVNVLKYMVVTAAVFHLERSALNVCLLEKTLFKLVTLATFQSSMGPYVARTVFLAVPPLIQSDTTLRRPVPAPLCDASPFGTASDPNGPVAQYFNLQNNPVDAVQSLVPQVHALSFAALASLIAHAATFAHLSTDAQQNNPLDSVQSLVPHTQLPVFAALPSVTVHVGKTQFNLAFSFGLYAADGQFWQALALTKGFNSGDAMYVPAPQQPYRAVLKPRLLNALLPPIKDNHAPPHKVRLKPLL